jgi:hypothetical protein
MPFPTGKPSQGGTGKKEEYVMKKIPDWVSVETQVEITNHPTAEAWVEEHENPKTGEHVYLALDTSGCDGGVVGVFGSFAEASNAIGDPEGFSDLWEKKEEIKMLKKVDLSLRDEQGNCPGLGVDETVVLENGDSIESVVRDYIDYLVTNEGFAVCDDGGVERDGEKYTVSTYVHEEA